MSLRSTAIETETQPTGTSVSPSRAPLLSIVVPTFNERDNVHELVSRLEAALAGIHWEAVFVDDDSTDGTPEVLRDLARSDGRVRHLLRIGRRGLSSAVVEGIMSTSAPYVAVIDADLQHDETVLPAMLEQLRTSSFDIVVGSRYMGAGGIDDGWAKHRQTISRVATKLAHLVLRTSLSDPMSGFFMMKRPAFDHAVRGLSSLGYKILLDILASARPPLQVAEVPYVFRTRLHGESKLDSAVTWEYLMLLLDKTIGGTIPVRFAMFTLVGGVGLLVHMFVLAVLDVGLQYSFVTSQIAATLVAMTFNFFVNNILTYRDQRLKGARQLLGGLFSFYAVCAIGAISNVGIAAVLFQRDYSWWLSGVSGVLVGAVWNYAVSSIFTWRK